MRSLTRRTLLTRTVPLVAAGMLLRCGGSARIAARARQTAGWQPAGNLAVGRAFATGISLADGRVLVAGGSAEGRNDPRKAELYDPAGDTVTPAGHIDTYGLLALGLLADGRVLSYGGVSEPRPLLFDPASLSWTPAARSVYKPFVFLSLTRLLDGRMLALGSAHDAASAEVYDPTADRWQALASPPLATPNLAALLPNGRVLVLGGRNEDGTTPIAHALRYDPTADAWDELPGLDNFVAALLPLADGTVLALGAEGPVFRFDPGSARWQKATPEPFTPYHDSGLVVLGDGRVLMAGGGGRRSGFYDPVADAWSAGPDLGTQRRDLVAAPLPNGGAVVIGGFGPFGQDGKSHPLTSIERLRLDAP